MKLLFLTQTYPRFEGDTSGPFIRDLARSLVAGGDEVTILTPHAERVRPRWDDDGVEVFSFRYAPRRFESIGYSRSLSSDEVVKKGAALVTPLYLLAARAAIRKQLAQRRYDLLHAHWVVPNGLVVAPFHRRIPLAVGLHGSDVFLAEGRVVAPFVRRALSRCTLLTGCSPELVNRVCAIGFPESSSRVIPYGVDAETFSPDPSRRGLWRERLRIPESAPMVLSVGRMVTKKGYHVLLPALPEILADHPKTHFVFGGAGDRLDEFRRVTEAHRDRVHFPGSVLRDTLPDLYRAADLFVLPAVHDRKGNVDGLPNVILEAMATGLPVVATAISGIPLAVEDGVSGVLVPERQAASLAAGISGLLGDRERCLQMGRRSRERVERDLTWSAIAGRYHRAYEDALASPRSSGSR